MQRTTGWATVGTPLSRFNASGVVRSNNLIPWPALGLDVSSSNDKAWYSVPPEKTSRVREAFACPFKAGRNLTNLNSVSLRFDAVQRHSHAPLAAMQVNRPSHFSLSRPGHVRSFLLLDSALSPESPHQSLSRPLSSLPTFPSYEPQTQSGWGNEREIFSFSSFFPPLAAPFRLRFVSLCSFFQTRLHAKRCLPPLKLPSNHVRFCLTAKWNFFILLEPCQKVSSFTGKWNCFSKIRLLVSQFFAFLHPWVCCRLGSEA